MQTVYFLVNSGGKYITCMSLTANITAANARRRRSQSVHKGECGEIGHYFSVKKKMIMKKKAKYI